MVFRYSHWVVEGGKFVAEEPRSNFDFKLLLPPR